MSTRRRSLIVISPPRSGSSWISLPGAEVAWCNYEDALVDPRRPLQVLAQMSDIEFGSVAVTSDHQIQRANPSIEIIKRFRTALETHDVKPDTERF